MHSLSRILATSTISLSLALVGGGTALADDYGHNPVSYTGSTNIVIGNPDSHNVVGDHVGWHTDVGEHNTENQKPPQRNAFLPFR